MRKPRRTRPGVIGRPGGVVFSQRRRRSAVSVRPSPKKITSIRFDLIPQPWLRTAVKRACRYRLGAGKAFGHQEWSSHVERAVYIAPKFYAVELALPWSSFQGARVAVPPKAGDTWRIDLYSFKDGQRHALAWSPLKGRGNFHKSSQFGRIQFAE